MIVSTMMNEIHEFNEITLRSRHLISFLSFISYPQRSMPDLLDIARSALANQSADDAPHYRWRVTLPDGNLLEVCCLPQLTAVEMLVRYPKAALEPLPDSPEIV